MLDEVFDAWFRYFKRHDGNVDQRDPVLKPVDSENSRSHLTFNPQVECQDGVAIPIYICKLIQARLILDDLGVIGCDWSHIVIEEARVGWTNRSLQGSIAEQSHSKVNGFGNIPTSM